MAFKLGNRKNNPTHSRGVRVIQTPLQGGELAEARNDGTIAINSDKVDTSNKPLMNRIIKHEMKHMKDMDEGRADYGDEWMLWDGKIYLRRDINGTKVIDGPNGRHPEGSAEHPWEQEAIAAEKQ